MYATNKSGSWVRRRLTSAKDQPYAIAVDAAQKAYIVFRREANDTVHFRLLTNRSGSWVSTRLPIIHSHAYDVHVVVDPNRKLHIAWNTDEHSWYATNAGGSWVRRRLDNALGNDAQVAVGSDGSVHLLFQQCLNDGSGTCDGAGIYHQTNASGVWTTEHISTDPEDHAQDLLVDPDGSVHLVFSREDNSQAQPDLPLGIFYMTNASGTWVTSRAAGPGRMAQIERAANGTIQVVYAHVDGNLGIFQATLRNGTWTRTEVIREYALYPSTGIEPDGRMHIAFMRMAIDPGVYHAVYVAGEWRRRELLD
jgi:hypothetical protein